MIRKSIIQFPTLIIALVIYCSPAYSAEALDTTITILNPSSGSQLLSFPQLGFDINFRAVLKGVCPASSIEGTLYTAENSQAIVSTVGDSAALFITFGHCDNAPITISDINGKVFEIATPITIFTLSVSDAGNNAIQFVFDDPNLLPLNKNQLALTPEKSVSHHNVLGQPMPKQLRSEYLLFH